MIKGLTHAAILVTDLERAVAFYRDILGLSEQFRLSRDDGSAWLVYLNVGDRQFIELFPGAAGQYEKRAGAGPVHICLEVDDIHKTFAELTGRGAPAPSGEPKLGADGSWQFWTQDPDGNPIEFHQFTPDSRQVSG